MDISVFFKPVSAELKGESATIAGNIRQHDSTGFPELDGAVVAIFGVRSGRGNAGNMGTYKGPDHFRKEFYTLSIITADLVILDLGDIEEGDSATDTEFAIRETCTFLMKQKIIPILIGGSHDLSYASYAAYEKMEHTVNLVTIDNKLDIAEMGDIRDSQNFLSHVILHQPNILFNFSNIGHQRSLIGEDMINLIEKMYFDTYRLGEVSGNIRLMEPVLRNADIVSFDLGAIRAADAPGNANARPNGLNAQEACQLCRYAGMSDKLSSIGFFELNPEFDSRGFTAQLLAEMVWYFIEGITLRKGDYPECGLDEYFKYIIDLEQHQLIFYKSDRSDRWWMDVPYPAGTKNKYERHHLVPCTYEDYQTATNDEVPDRWWRTYQKLV